MATSAHRLIGGRYRLGDLVGEGAMSTVSRAHDEMLDRCVALKLLKPAFARDQRLVDRFFAEARSAAQLVHPHVVAIFDVVSEPRAHAVVMEFVDGRSLAEVLRADGRVPVEAAIGYGRATAQALMAAHAQGIVHGDLKPANLLLSADGCLKVTDFGLGPGTTEYAAPEQSLDGVPSPLWDVYALGVLLRTLTAGAADPRLDSVIERMTQADPAERYPSAEAADLALAESAGRPAGAFVESPTLLVAPASKSGPPPPLAAIPRRPPKIDLEPQLRRLRALSASHVEPWLKRAFAAARTADRRYWAPALAVVLLMLMLAAWAGGAQVAVADMRHQRSASAEARLRRDGLAAVVQMRPDAREEAGRVLAQTPAAGTLLRRGEAVHLVVSSGLPLAAVPDLLGQTLARANGVMLAAKLRPKYAAKITDDPPNTVIDEVPAAGTKVHQRSQVLLIISTGPHPAVTYSGGDGGD